MNSIVYFNTVLIRSTVLDTINTGGIVVESQVEAEAEAMKAAVTYTEEDGWHPIHVYYGIREPLPPSIDSTPWREGSQVGQDLMILALMKEYQHIRSKNNDIQQQQYFFVDLAANDAIKLSNTYNLEKNDWTGLCIEPNRVYWERLAHRKCTVVAAFVGGKEDLQLVNVSLSHNALGGIVGEDMDNQPDPDTVYTQKYTVSLQSVFQRYQVPYDIDYFSLDVEGAESIVMRYFPFDQYFFRFMTVERPKSDLRAIFQSHGYEYIKDISSFGETLWVHESVIQKGLTMDQIQSIVDGFISTHFE